MASHTLPAETRERFADGNDEAWGGLPDALSAILKPLASLKLTVTCFAMAIFIVLAGTVAQIDKDIWEVMGTYFRTPLAWIPLSIFFPRSIEVPGGFFFPGGFTIGLVMLVNLFAAHAVRFKVQASGARLAAGLGVIAAGVAMTWLVIASGSNHDGLQVDPMIPSSVLWMLTKMVLTALWLGTVCAAVKINPSRKLERIVLGVLATALGILLTWLWYKGDEAALGDSSMRILWQLIKALLVSLVLLAGAIMVFRKRAGIVLLHSGVALMMLNELVVYTLHVEGQMQIKEGETVNFVQDVRTLELAVVDTSNLQHDEVVVVPQSILALNRGTDYPVVRDAKLPFDVQVVQFMQNSQLRKARPGEKTPADQGFGAQRVVEEIRPGAGTDSSSEIDMSAAYVTFLKKGGSEPLGTYLVGLYQSLQDLPETVSVDGKQYDVYLRFKRDYKPYSMHLIDVRFDRYMGTDKPKNYSSDVRLVDPSRNVDRTLRIWMNNPLRYAGETFYQSNFSQDMTGHEITGLQVVTNAGWMIPYVACMIVATGLLTQFLIVLSRFLQRTSEMEPVVAAASRRSRKAAAPTATPNMYTWMVPLLAVLVFAGWLGSKAREPSIAEDRMNLYEFGKLPLVYEGRVKPFDTLARNSLRILSDREILVDNADETRPAIEWLLDVITDPGKAAEYRVFRIQNLEVLDTLGLKRRKYYRYAIAEFQPKLGEFQAQLKRAQDTPEAELSVFQKKLLELSRRLNLYMMLGIAFEQTPISQENEAEDLLKAIRYQDTILERMQPPRPIPPTQAGGTWEPYSKAFLKAWAQTNFMAQDPMRQDPNPATLAMHNMLVAYARQDDQTFNAELGKYQARLKRDPPQELNSVRTNFEAFFNHFRPFYHLMFIYLAAFVLTCIGWLGWQGPLNRAAFWLIVLAFVVQTLALVGRIYISGRPPVTNLFSTAPFIGWACVALGLLVEAIYSRRTAAMTAGAAPAALGLGIGNILASVLGFATLVIADFLAADGDTFTVLQAVLDTQFWLSTHVLCITLGYATTFFAGFLGIAYILSGVFTRALSPMVAKELYRMTYGIVCFSIFFSFVGTVLGGLWADDSWGRFWGWDPKENGALIIVLWNALVLHARWGGMVRERGLAVLAVVGNIAVSWSWFGVNNLGTGLHSYGFTEGVAVALAVFFLSQVAIVLTGLLPKRLWRSQAAA